MIRFIEIGDQIVEGRRDFAWYNTINDSFLSFYGEQAWTTWEEFKEAYNADIEPVGFGDSLERFKWLYPEGREECDEQTEA